MTGSGIVVLRSPIEARELRRLVEAHFEDMVEFVVDVERDVIAVGGELHADAEHVLLEQGSHPRDLWGANYYPGRGREECVEYTALINIRPSQGNLSMEIESPEIRARVAALAAALIGTGEPLA